MLDDRTQEQADMARVSRGGKKPILGQRAQDASKWMLCTRWRVGRARRGCPASPAPFRTLADRTQPCAPAPRVRHRCFGQARQRWYEECKFGQGLKLVIARTVRSCRIEGVVRAHHALHLHVCLFASVHWCVCMSASLSVPLLLGMLVLRSAAYRVYRCFGPRSSSAAACRTAA